MNIKWWLLNYGMRQNEWFSLLKFQMHGVRAVNDSSTFAPKVEVTIPWWEWLPVSVLLLHKLNRKSAWPWILASEHCNVVAGKSTDGQSGKQMPINWSMIHSWCHNCIKSAVDLVSLQGIYKVQESFPRILFILFLLACWTQSRICYT